MGRLNSKDYSFEARWGNTILDGGIATIPTIILKHQGDLSLTNGEFALCIQALAYKWTANDPFVSAGELAHRMGTTTGNVYQLTHSLHQKGYLDRYCVDKKRNRWVWDFSGLLRNALELEGMDPGLDAGVLEPESEPEPERVSSDSRGSLAITKGGSLARTKGGSLAIAKPEEEQPREEKPETEQTAGALGKPGADHQKPQEEKDCLSVNSDLIERANKLGYHNIACEISKYGADYVREKLGLTEKTVKDGKVKNAACFLNAALRNDFRVEQKPTAKDPRSRTEEEDEDESPLRKVWRSLSEEQQEDVMHEAQTRLSDRERDELYKGFVSKQGLSGAIKEVWNFAIAQVLITRGYLAGAAG